MTKEPRYYTEIDIRSSLRSDKRPFKIAIKDLSYAGPRSYVAEHINYPSAARRGWGNTPALALQDFLTKLEVDDT